MRDSAFLYVLRSLLRLALRSGTFTRQSRFPALDPEFHGAVGVPSTIGRVDLRQRKRAPLPCEGQPHRTRRPARDEDGLDRGTVRAPIRGFG